MSSTAQQAAPIGILGGTFDPVHHGHLRPALEAMEELGLAEVRLIPCRQPPHRQSPSANPDQRQKMLEHAVGEQQGFVVDDRELRRQGPSYMVDTLASLRAELGPRPLCLLLGTDAFHGLPQWRSWQQLLERAHLVVLHRPGWPTTFTDPLGMLVERHRLTRPTDLCQHPGGGIWFQSVTQLDISATEIRALLRQGRSPRYLLPESVHTFIDANNLYR